jgi:hypothetical protein
MLSCWIMARRRATYRPSNVCGTCSYSWQPRGHNVSASCPNCGSRNVTVPNPFAGCGTLLLWFVGLGTAAFVLDAISAAWSAIGTSGQVALVLVTGLVIGSILVIRRGRRIARQERKSKQRQEEQAQALAAEQQRQLEEQQRALLAERQRAARWQQLCATFGEPAALRIVNGRIWVGQGRDMLVAALGEPRTSKQRVLKTKTKEVWSYWPDDRGRHRLKIDLEDHVVIGWETLEGTSAPSTPPP